MAYKENYPSKLLEEAVDAIGSLPGVGRRSALRLALHLLRHGEAALIPDDFVDFVRRPDAAGSALIAKRHRDAQG